MTTEVETRKVEKMEIQIEENNIDNEFKLKQYAEKIFKNRAGKIFTKKNAGMGCAWYIRRSDPYSKMEIMFMHSDSWGQYGDLTNRQEFDKFIFDYDYVDERCPITDQGSSCIVS